MKKTILALSVLVSSTVMAAPVGKTFTGLGVGLDLTSTKYQDAKRATGVGVVVDYGFDYGNNLVGLVEGKLKVNSSKLVDESYDDGNSSESVKENGRVSLSYLQGYRVLPDLLPYVKVGYTVTKIKAEEKRGNSYTSSSSDTATGLNYGLGVKYALSSNVEVGAEFVRHSAKANGDTIKANNLGVSGTYRF